MKTDAKHVGRRCYSLIASFKDEEYWIKYKYNLKNKFIQQA